MKPRDVILIAVLAMLSCPHPQFRVETIPDAEIIAEARRTMTTQPLYACSLLNEVRQPGFLAERNEVMLALYLEQREYHRASALLDSMHWRTRTDPARLRPMLIATRNWERIVDNDPDSLLTATALYELARYPEALARLPARPRDYVRLLRAQILDRSNASAQALGELLQIDSLSSYLVDQYQKLLVELLLKTEGIQTLQAQMKRVKSPSQRMYLQLRIHERTGAAREARRTAWKIIRQYPASSAAYYAASVVTPKTKDEHRAVAAVYYRMKDYRNALKHYQQSTYDGEVAYYIGRCYYETGSPTSALASLNKSRLAAAYYYRGRIYEDRGETRRAVAVYDSLHELHPASDFAQRALRREGFLFEDLGDTLSAARTFLRVKDKNARFRSALDLYRMGKLDEAAAILAEDSIPSYLYWSIRVRERLGLATDSLQELLVRRNPLSYYTLIRSSQRLLYDTMDLDVWLSQWGDTTLSFDREDSVRCELADRYFRIGKFEYACAELEAIEDKSYHDYVWLSRYCAAHGYDRGAIRFMLQLKQRLENRGIRVLPYGFLRLLYPVRYRFTIRDQALSPQLVLALIWQESLFDPSATSPARAQGLMQIIPGTGEVIADALGVTEYPLYDAAISIRFGCHYLRQLMGEFEFIPLALAGYNAGPARVKRWVAKNPNLEMDEFIEYIPYDETREYVKLVLARQEIYRSVLGDDAALP